jgi:hypothetical protein
VSGITPLLDTLLHQVLGRRVDIPVPRDLNAAVSAPVPAQGARPLHSDSRLDPREQAPVAQASAAVRSQAANAPAPRTPGASETPQPQPQSSTTTSFSAAARLIGDLLQRFPAPPAVITPASPLLAEAPAGPQVAARIAGQLQQSIQSSGLFYEAHVARWTRGELPLEVLQREPQMRAASISPQPSALQGVSMAQEPAAAPGSAVVYEPAPALPGERPAPAEQRVEAVDQEAVAGEPEGDTVGETQLPLLRQQLELLAAPQLRWEGNVWAGVFMALVIQPPAAEPLVDDGGEREGEGAPGQGAWQVRLALRLDGHGELEVAISLQGERLALTLQTESASLRGYFAQTRGALEECLAGYGFSEVSLRLREGGEEADDGR